MFTKKNYKQQDHFTNFYSIIIPTKQAKKCTIYYKRHIPTSIMKKSDSNINIYDLIKNKGKKSQNQTPKLKQQFPLDRTLEAITFDDALKLEEAKKLFRKLGKIRKFVTGEGSYKGRDIHYAFIVFKFQFDLVKAFREEYLQNIINQELKDLKIHEEQAEDYRVRMIDQHLSEQLTIKMDKIKTLKDEGFQMVTDRYGNFKIDYEANVKFTEDLPQIKKIKKQELKKIKKAQEGQEKQINKKEE